MTVPEDDLEKALRQALSAAVSQVEPAADGLDRIRARTSRRLPQPWLLSIASAAIGKARNYVRRGYDALHEHFFLGTTVSRAVVLVGVAFLACIGLAVSPLRQTIVQVGSTVLTGNSGGGKSGGGTPTGTGTETGSGQSSRGTGRTAKGSPSPGSTRRPQCKPAAAGGTASVTGIVAVTLASPAQGPSDEAAGLPLHTRPAPQCSASASPAASASPPAVASLTPVASPSGTAPASPTASPSMSPSPTPAPSPSAASTSTPTAPPTGSGPATPPTTTSSTGGATSGAVAPSLEPSVSPSNAGLTGSAP
jgi:hypothetical protein